MNGREDRKRNINVPVVLFLAAYDVVPRCKWPIEDADVEQAGTAYYLVCDIAAKRCSLA